jgi:hypothetical protein
VLEDLRLLRRDGNRYSLAFFLYTKADLDKLRAVSESEGRTLAAAFLARRGEIMTILKDGALPGDDVKALAYFILGCVSLDWDGLNFTREKGYRTEGPIERDLREPGGGGDRRELYWGSNNWHDAIAFTTFGDHASGPRYALPNVLFGLSSNAREPLRSTLPRVAGMLFRRHAGSIMLALRDGARDTSYLAGATGLAAEDVREILEVLTQLHYVRADGERYRAAIPVLAERDAGMVRDLRRLGREVTAAWFAQHHSALERQLSDFTAVRQGVPLSDGFYWVWHYLFGVANRELVRAGLFADPYAPERAFKGFIPAVYPLHIVMGRDVFR